MALRERNWVFDGFFFSNAFAFFKFLSFSDLKTAGWLCLGGGERNTFDRMPTYISIVLFLKFLGILTFCFSFRLFAVPFPGSSTFVVDVSPCCYCPVQLKTQRRDRRRTPDARRQTPATTGDCCRGATTFGDLDVVCVWFKRGWF